MSTKKPGRSRLQTDSEDVPLKRRTSCEPHRVTTQQTVIFTVTIVKTSNAASDDLSFHETHSLRTVLK
jgi:hypothetical protein